jgi:hypothetical protein
LLILQPNISAGKGLLEKSKSIMSVIRITEYRPVGSAMNSVKFAQNSGMKARRAGELQLGIQQELWYLSYAVGDRKTQFWPFLACAS